MARPPPSAQVGFTLAELAVTFAIIGLLLGGLIYSLSAQTEQRHWSDTQRTLEAAREALLGFAVANGRLPCPASSTSNGIESPSNGTGACTNYYDGFLPAVTLGFQPVNDGGYAVDAWNNPIRYAVAQNINVPVSCAGTSSTPHFTSKTNLKQNGMSCLPHKDDLLVCKAKSGAAVGSCGSSNSVTREGTVVAIVFSTGKNYASAPNAAQAQSAGREDEAENINGDALFVSHLPTPSGASGGEFDDLLVWIPVGSLYGRMTTAGVLP